jgi:hypothetical protein
MRNGLWPLLLCGVVLGCSGRGSGSDSPVAPPVEPGPTPPPTPPPTEGLAIASITPAELVEGRTATITGHGFKTFAALNTVLVGGSAATVTAATATELQIVVPSLCRPTGPVDVQVRVGTASTEVVPHPLRSSAQPLRLAAGEMALVGAPDALCLQFESTAADEQYLVGVQSTSEDVSSMLGLRVRATPDTGPGALAPSADRAIVPDRPVGGRRLPSDRLRDLLARHRTSELRYRAREVALARAGLASVEAMRRAGAGARLTPAAVPQVGDRLPIRVPDHMGTNPCAEFVEVSGLVRYVGRQGIFVVDEANPSGGFSDAQLAELARSFDEDIHPVLVERFGAPLDMDGNGRVIVVLTRKLNEWLSTAGVLGFVTSVDLVPRATCPSSNHGEYYYSFAPDPAGELGTELSAADALELERVLIAHETTHVIQFGRRAAFPGATGHLPRWQAEGQAMLAEEVVSYRLRGRTTGANYGPDVLFDDDRRSWHGSAFVDLFGYYGFRTPTLRVAGAPEQCSFLGAPEEGNRGPCLGNMAYGVSWSFLRWLSDQFGPAVGGEAALHRAIIESPNTGFATIERVVGEPRSRLLAWWAASLRVDDRLAGADPRLSWSSWDLAGIEESVVETGRLSPRARGFSAFDDAIFVRAGSTAYYLLGGGGRPATSFRVRTLTSGAPPPEVQVWVVRLR